VKILYLMTEPFGIGGVQSDLLALSEDLTGRGHEVHVATTPGVLLKELIARGAIFHEIDFHVSGLLGLVGATRALRRLISAHDFDVVAPQSVRSSLVAKAALTGRGRRPPIVTTIHNIHSPRHFSYVGRILDLCSDFVVFESHYERDRVVAGGLPSTKTLIIHSGIDAERFFWRPADEELCQRYGIDPLVHRTFGIVARLSEEKGHHFLFEAFSRLVKEHSTCRLLVVGEGPLRAELEDHARRLGLDQHLIFTGSQRDVPRHLSLIETFVLSSSRESFPLAAREAMAARKAVVAPRIGGVPEVVVHDETGYLFESGNVADLLGCLRSMLADGVTERFGKAGLNRCLERFSRKVWIDGNEQVYREWSEYGKTV